jgi:tRNA nucleotidyltransferase/poly(A) polymerase
MKNESIIENSISSIDKEFIQMIQNHKFNNLEIFLVGGAIRDILMGREPKELDFCINGDTVEFINFIDNQKDIKKIKVSEFNTYKLFYKNKYYDFSVTREESYIPKGSLPKIDNFNVSIKKDLYRRDFTINSIAINLVDLKNDLIDPFDGIEDISRKEIKIIHKDSFNDDPTRIFRAIKFSKRLKFIIEKKSLNELNKSIINIKKLSKDRIKNEIEKISFEPNCKEILVELKKLGALKFFYDFEPSEINFNQKKISNWALIIYSIAMINSLDKKDIISEINIRKELRKKINDLVFLTNLAESKLKITKKEFKILKKIDQNLFEDLLNINENYSTILNNYKNSLLRSNAHISFSNIKKIKSCTDLEASIMLYDIEYKKFNDLLRTMKDEIEFIENYIL